MLDAGNNIVAAETPDAEFHEQVALRVVTGNRASFLYPYMLLLLCFSLCVAFCIVAALATFMALTFSKAKPDDIAAFFNIVASFDFDNAALTHTSEAQTDALAAAISLAAGAAFLVLSILFGLTLRVLKNKKTSERVVSALLPGYKRGFVPCAEGIYKAVYRNRFYCLYPWESLSLYGIEEKKKRVVLKAGNIQMPLLPKDGKTGLFENLKAVVQEHLPSEKQSLPTKKAGYRWGRVAVAVLAIFVLQAVLSGWYERASGEGAGNEYCDIGGKVHFTYKTAFGPEVYIMWIFGDEDEIRHTYCPLHGAVYLLLHPLTYVESVGRIARENTLSEVASDQLLVSYILIFPPAAWLYLLISVLWIGKPRTFRFNTL